MGSNWWKRLFHLDDEEEFLHQKQNQDDNTYQSSHNPIVGRFEDTNRQIHVRMLHQYPNSTSKDVTPNSRQSFKDTPIPNHDHYESASEHPAHHRKASRKSDDKWAKNQESQETSQSPKKSRFKPTEIISPVYGYKKTPEHFYRQMGNVNEMAKNDQKVTQEANNLTVSSLNTKDKQQVNEKKLNQPAYQRKENKLIENVDSKTNLQKDVHSIPFKRSQKEEKNEEKNIDFMTSDTKEGLDDFPENRPKKVKTDLHSEQYDSKDNNVKKSDADVQNQENTMEKDETPVKREFKVSPHRQGRRGSKVPFNVLMFRTDKKNHKNNHEQPKKIKSLEQKDFQISLDVLDDPPESKESDSVWIEEKRAILKEALDNFHVNADIVDYTQGPAVTRFEIHLHPGVKVNKIMNLTEDIKLSMAAEQIRIAPVIGKSTVGIEIPNDERKPVYLKDLLHSEAFKDQSAALPAILGQDISGQQVITDLAKMPHGLIAGATGSGKSVCIHSLILSLIYKTSPERLRLILIDPKVVELAAYRELPHLATPVITEPKEASLSLKWAVEEMEKRYQYFAKMGVRDIKRYNECIENGQQEGEIMPYIVIIIDELADLMMVSPQDVEEAICRIAQKARAAGIHLLLATQRPSVDVITGLIKSNIPTRIAFSVSSQVDSRTILDSSGAERLLGQGDMLFIENGARDIKRLQGCFVSDEEISRISAQFDQMESPPYLFDKEDFKGVLHDNADMDDELFDEAGYFVIDQGQASVSSLQRRFRIGYNRAARLIDDLQAMGIVSEANGSKPRQVLVSKEEFEDQIINQDKVY
ncbi:DNA translocase FtsK [Terrilactibacillus sp. BCM23-1]|uniref:DNA translocase FtsK n=1 Tax=Terrilactibacillus tamarindi TaxID=2599694 RepID=A0A6N8CQN1_9BACI|nr:DNA translocase FtsK [Terrilactibacillus tamarindi]MTT32529.1 DNA translocase FtsK [Terrilactibacillus tamarindi]